MSLPTTFFIGRGAKKVLEELILVGGQNGSINFYSADLNTLVATTGLAGSNAESFTFDGTHFFIGNNGYVNKVDTDFNYVSSYGTGGYQVAHMCATRDHIWYATAGNDTVYKLSKDFSTISSTSMSGAPIGLSITPNYVIGFSNNSGGSPSIHRWDHNFNNLSQATDVQNSRAGFTDTNYIYNTQQTGDDIVRHTYGLSYNATSADVETSYMYGLGLDANYIYAGGNDERLRRYPINLSGYASSTSGLGACRGITVSNSGIYYMGFAGGTTHVRRFNTALSQLNSIGSVGFTNADYHQMLYSTHQIGGPSKYYDPSITDWDMAKNASNILLPV